MTEGCDSSNLSINFNNLNMRQSTSKVNNELLTSNEVCISDTTHNYLPGSYRCEKYDYSSAVDQTNLTVTSTNVHSVVDNNLIIQEVNHNQLQIPIVGYEVMEERARFTVYKLRVENKSNGDCWYVFRRYTDFVRLCSRLKHSYPSLALLMPRKKYFGNNFAPTFLEERVQGLQEFVNAIICIPELLCSSQIQDFFCLNEPPAYSDTSDESRAIFEALEDTIYQLRHQLRDKESLIENLHTTLNKSKQEIDYLKTFVQSSTKNCQKCCKDYENYQKSIKHDSDTENSVSSTSKI